MNIKDSWLKSGYVNEPVPTHIDIKKEIIRLKEEKDAIIMAHFYQTDEIQDIADFVGDSLALAQEAAKTDAKIIVLAGVHFMGETAKILSPDKLVLVPDLNAGCSLADSCPPEEFKAFVDQHPDHTVLTYVNTTAKIKALSDIVVTSTNAKNVVDSLPKEEKIIFGPDRNLGNYLNSISGRDMLLWDGACHVHEKFSVEKIVELKKEHPEAVVLAHPECKKPLLLLADFVGSTAALLKHSINSDANKFIVATESGIIHQMQKESPDKVFIPAPPNDSTCACNDCEYMKLNTMEKLYNSLKYEWPSIDVDEDIRKDAVKPINRMLDISKKAGL
ncbi:quinolinate synthase NadA [Carboxylicivirga sp. RSCT41]|uniref:quinolinate synthase NadA n=1 Tax=Carboxylicivirga agarovorans TaxID=3417570 RepID=UPI003D34B2DB